MKTILSCCLMTIIIGITNITAMAQTRPENTADQTTLSSANSKFACDLYAHLKTSNGNLFFSPFSISTALAMTQTGARGQTAKEMQDVLGLTPILTAATQIPHNGPVGVEGEENDIIGNQFSALLKQINAASANGNTLAVADALWGQAGLTFDPHFTSFVAEEYSGKMSPVDFHAPDQAAKTINDWIEKQTAGKIKDLIEPAKINGARLVLTNAIYFKGAWELKFDPHRTIDAPFNVTADKKITTPMMHRTAMMPYFASDTMQALEMPFQGKDLTMLVLLPRQTIADAEKQLTPAALSDLLKNMKPTELAISFPKFKMTRSLELGSVLTDMGMKLALDPHHADFSGIMTQEPLFISDIIHKAYVAVDEEGAEAAAATGVGMRAAVARATPTFIADHPFLFLIRHNPTGSILFLGRLNNPTE